MSWSVFTAGGALKTGVTVATAAANQTISASNTDLAWMGAGSSLVSAYVSVGGGTLRSIGIPDRGAGTRLMLRAGASFSVLLPTGGGSGATIRLQPATTRVLAIGDTVEFYYDGSEWFEIGNTNGGAWQSYTPTWSSTGTPPTLGNGTTTGRYCQVGKAVHFQWALTIGSTSTAGTGTYTISMPVTAATPLGGPLGSGYVFDNSAGALWTTAVRPAGGTDTSKFEALFTNAASAFTWAAGAPFVIGTSDGATGSGTYDAA